MNKNIHIAITGISLIINIVLVIFIYVGNHGVDSQDLQKDVKYREECAQNLLRQIITSELYFPESYDPVTIRVDSAFHGPLTDYKCVIAAEELIDLRSKLPQAENAYKEALNTLKNFGSSGVFWRHAEDKKNAEEHLKTLKENITKRELIIKDRDSSHDGEFIGWGIAHRYRAKNQGGNVSFSDVLYIVSPDMTEWSFRYNMDKNDRHNLNQIIMSINQTLGIGMD